MCWFVVHRSLFVVKFKLIRELSELENWERIENTLKKVFIRVNLWFRYFYLI